MSAWKRTDGGLGAASPPLPKWSSRGAAGVQGGALVWEPGGPEPRPFSAIGDLCDCKQVT